MIVDALVPTSGVDVLTVPAGATYAVLLIAICNYSGSTRTVDVYVIPSGGSAGNQTKIVSTRSLEANDSLFLDQQKIILGAGDKINVAASVGSSLNVMVSFYSL